MFQELSMKPSPVGIFFRSFFFPQTRQEETEKKQEQCSVGGGVQTTDARVNMQTCVAPPLSAHT